MFDSPLTTNDQSIDRVLAVGLPVLLVFLNGPAPSDLEAGLDKLAREHAGKLLVAKVQVKENPEAVRRYQVNSTPALAGISNGQVRTKGERVSVQELEQHALYLLGQGPKPQSESEQPYSRPQGGSTNGQGQPAANQPVSVSDANFEQQVMRSSLPVLVDFWAPWCGPCRMTEPILNKLASELAGRVLIAKVNVDENPATSQRYGIQSIPTMMVVKNGKIVDRWMGALPEPALRNRLANSL